MKSSAHFISIPAAALALAVLLGAFGAHGLKDVLDTYHREVYEKAVFYHFTNSLGALVVGLAGAASVLPRTLCSRVCILLLVGVVLFSGSLYLLAVTGHSWLGAITPFGGLSFIVAWSLLAWGSRRAFPS